MVDRNNNRRVYRNIEDSMEKQRKDRGRKSITQYTTANYNELTVDQIITLDVVDHTWKSHDSLTALAHEHYGDITLWWVIAYFNELGSEIDLEQGDVIGIPSPINRVLNYMGI